MITRELDQGNRERQRGAESVLENHLPLFLPFSTWRRRSQELELLDKAQAGRDFDLAEYEHAYRELELINRITNGYGPTIAAIEQVARRRGEAERRSPFRVLDIGFGYGDTLRAIRRWADRIGLEVELEGVDLHPWARVIAEQATPATYDIRYHTSDIFAFEGETYDMIINALFMHHLADDQIVRLLRWMTLKARRAWFINDLHRSPIAYALARGTIDRLSASRFVKYDAPLSVARSFRKRDWWRYVREAGLDPAHVHVTWHWLFRYGVFYDANL
jgi:2-polyprenyl-3-methyl-5-hydroxy-6-metoxy-1,4-benzoquinol methylase